MSYEYVFEAGVTHWYSNYSLYIIQLAKVPKSQSGTSTPV